MSIEKFTFPEGDVVVIEVFPSSYPPIRYRGQAWVRIGARKALASDEDLHLFAERRQHSAPRFEIMACSAASLNDLDLELFRNIYLPKAIQSEATDEDERTIEEKLASLQFWDRNLSCPTNLGMLLFGKHPDMYIPSAYLQYVKFRGDDNSGDIISEHAYKGALLKMITDLDGFIKVGIASPHPVVISTLQERTHYNYPEWAVRELILNAIIHRDYQLSNAPVKIYEYDDKRLEISNSGGLYGQANIRNFPNVNDYRNPMLAEAMKIMGFVNKFNRGIARVKSEMEKNGNPPPIFDITKQTEFRVTLLSAKDAVNEQNNGVNTQTSPQEQKNDAKTRTSAAAKEQAVIRVIAQHPGIKLAELSQKTAIAMRTLRRILHRATEDSILAKIEYRGSKKIGGWFPKV